MMRLSGLKIIVLFLYLISAGQYVEAQPFPGSPQPNQPPVPGDPNLSPPFPGSPSGQPPPNWPRILISASKLDFGTVLVGERKALMLDITNVGRDSLLIGSLTLSHPDLGLSLENFSLAEGTSQQIEVTFEPPYALSVGTVLSVDSNDPFDPVVQVRVVGLVDDREIANLADGIDPALADFNGDKEVNFRDFIVFVSGFSDGNPILDLNGDNQVKGDDFLIFAQFYGRKL